MFYKYYSKRALICDSSAWKPSQIIGTLLPYTLIIHNGEYDAEFSLRCEVTAVSFMMMFLFNNILFRHLLTDMRISCLGKQI